jgi:hypothetical protein
MIIIDITKIHIILKKMYFILNFDTCTNNEF